MNGQLAREREQVAVAGHEHRALVVGGSQEVTALGTRCVTQRAGSVRD